MTDVIKTEHLTKHFGKVKAVSDLSIKIKKGEIYGFLGLNGAGKTTTIRLLLGIIRPTSGSAFIFGKQVKAGMNDIWNTTGYLVEIPYSYPDLTVRENLEIIRRLRSIKEKNVVDSIITKLKLGEHSDKLVKNLSQGNAQRLGLAKALMHDPELLILDEPANGLDPAGIVEIRELLHDLAYNKGVTVFISSHILDEISKFASKIGIIHEGRLIQETATEKMGHLFQKKLLLNSIDNKSAIQLLIKNKYPVKVNEDGILEIKSESACQNPENIATLLVNAGLPPTLLKVEEEDLESYFLRTIRMKGLDR